MCYTRGAAPVIAYLPIQYSDNQGTRFMVLLVNQFRIANA